MKVLTVPGKTPVVKTWRRDERSDLIHDGDCHFWDRRVCTCGLLHQLRPMANRADLMHDVDKQLAAHDTVMDRLLHEAEITAQANEVMEQPDRELTAAEHEEIETIFKPRDQS